MAVDLSEEAIYQQTVAEGLSRCARALYVAWRELELHHGDFSPASAWHSHHAVLDELVSRDEIRDRLGPNARASVDQFAQRVPRCRCGLRLVGLVERGRGLCGDCALEFMADAEAEAEAAAQADEVFDDSV